MRAPDKSMVMFNSYEVAPENELVVTFITKVSPKDAQLVRRDPQSTGILAKLDSIILGNAEYLRNIWGSQLGFDLAYHKISWQ